MSHGNRNMTALTVSLSLNFAWFIYNNKKAHCISLECKPVSTCIPYKSYTTVLMHQNTIGIKSWYIFKKGTSALSTLWFWLKETGFEIQSKIIFMRTAAGDKYIQTFSCMHPLAPWRWIYYSICSYQQNYLLPAAFNTLDLSCSGFVCHCLVFKY